MPTAIVKIGSGRFKGVYYMKRTPDGWHEITKKEYRERQNVKTNNN